MSRNNFSHGCEGIAESIVFTGDLIQLLINISKKKRKKKKNF